MLCWRSTIQGREGGVLHVSLLVLPSSLGAALGPECNGADRAGNGYDQGGSTLRH